MRARVRFSAGETSTGLDCVAVVLASMAVTSIVSCGSDGGGIALDDGGGAIGSDDGAPGSRSPLDASTDSRGDGPRGVGESGTSGAGGADSSTSSGETGASSQSDSASPLAQCTPGGIAGQPGPGVTSLDPVPSLPSTGSRMASNACNPALPAAWGTNFPYPADPFAPESDGGHTVKNQSTLGWEENEFAPFAYLSGSFFARGVPGTYSQGASTYCGTMFSFGVYGSGGVPGAASVTWTMDEGYLPALTTSFSNGDIAISITNFADRVSIGGTPFVLVYSRVRATNNGTAATTVDPQPSPGLTALTNPANDVGPGQTSIHDYVAAVDDFGAKVAPPSGSMLSAAAPMFDAAYADMKTYWTNRLSVIPILHLPDVALPNTGGLSMPGTALVNAYKAAFIYTHIVQTGKAQFSAANNYDNLLNHDVPEILANRFTLGDLQDAPNLLLTARTSEATNYPEYGANWYWDGVWKSPWPWAVYLAKTGDTSFVSQYMHDDSGASNGGGSSWGPSLYTMMHELPGQLTGAGYLDTSNDNDSMGRWLFDDYSAFIGLAAYKYIASRVGDTAEATWADGQLTSLMAATNTGVANNQSANQFSQLPCEVDVPPSFDRCNVPSDANWASPVFYGQNAWDTFLMGGNPTGAVGDPAQVDGLYDWGFGRLNGILPFPTMGGYNATSFSTANNTGYAEGALFGVKYRDLPITSYAWQIATTTGGPNAWWEAVSGPPDPSDPWEGSHGPVEFGACPYAWPLAGQTLALIRSIVAEGLSATESAGTFSYSRPLYIGRGIPDAWIAPGETTSVSNITSLFSSTGANACTRETYGISVDVTKPASQRVVTISLQGSLPGGPVYIQLPSFRTAGVSDVQGGTYDAASATVTAASAATSVVVTLTN